MVTALAAVLGSDTDHAPGHLTDMPASTITSALADIPVRPVHEVSPLAARWNAWRADRSSVPAGWQVPAVLGVESLRGLDLSGINLSGMTLTGVRLGGAKLRGANLIWADLHAATLPDAILRDAHLAGANLAYTNLCRASLIGADLCEANLDNTELIGTNFRGADLTAASMFNTLLDGTNFRDAITDGLRIGTVIVRHDPLLNWARTHADSLDDLTKSVRL